MNNTVDNPVIAQIEIRRITAEVLVELEPCIARYATMFQHGEYQKLIEALNLARDRAT